MKPKLYSAKLVVLILSFVTCCNGAGESKASYETKVPFASGRVIELPDFTLEYVGQHRTNSERYPRGFLFYDFKIRVRNLEKSISWSNGTGEIAPLDFEIDGKHFLLELQRSDKLGPLKENELVIWQK